jgi:hypothetical protein
LPPTDEQALQPPNPDTIHTAQSVNDALK